MAQKILIVDDDDYTRDLYVELLNEQHYEVDVAADGEEGLNKILNGAYDLILLDVMMPRLDGLAVLRKLQGSMPKCPIILLTNLDHQPIREEGFKLGAQGYLIKADFTPQALLERIMFYLDKSQKTL